MEVGPTAEIAVSRGSCAGYEVHSSARQFMALRSGGGERLLVEDGDEPSPTGEVMATWQARPGNPFHGRLLRDGRSYAFWASDAGWYLIDPSRRRITMSGGAEPLRAELRLFGIPAAICAFDGGDLPLHASAVEVAGQAVVLAAPTMHGKTTLAAAFAGEGHRLLSEDTIRCSLTDVPSVFPGPAVVRLRSDVAQALVIPGATAAWTSAEDGRTAFVFDESARGSGHAVPLRAVLMLRSGIDRATLTRVPAAEAARDLFALAFRLNTDESRAACFTRAVDLAANVEVMNLHRPMTIASLREVVSLVEQHVAGPG